MEFLTHLSGFWLYAFIFVGKVTEVTFATLRITFVGKGIKKLGALFGAGEIFLWVVITSTVLSNISSDPLRLVVYCAAFIAGILLGCKIEEMMAVGFMSVQVVSLQNEKVSEALWKAGYGVTILEGKSVDGHERSLIFTQLKRKDLPEAMSMIQKIDPSAVVSVSSVARTGGGYLKK